MSDNLASPLDVGFISRDFGIFFPSDSGFNIRKQTGGVSCRQLDLTGYFYGLGRPTLRQGYPDWLPESNGIKPGEKHPVTELDLAEDIPERDYESLPEWIKDRGHFYNFDEFFYWLDSDDVWWHWALDLVEEVRRWNYDPTGEIAIDGRDMTERWDSLDDIWAAIDDALGFTYEPYPYSERRIEALNEDRDVELPFDHTVPGPCEGIRWITITGSKYSPRDTPYCPWAEQLKGETVLLFFPNCD